MATKTSLIINAVNEGKTLQKAIADVNPQATTAELKAFAQGMLGLTDYTYTNGALVERTGIDGEIPLATCSFWLGDEKIELYFANDWYAWFPSFAELKENPNVTHENGYYTFLLEIRDVYTADQKHLLPTTGGLFHMFGHDEDIKWTQIFRTNVAAFRIEIPENHEPTTDGTKFLRGRVLGTPRSSSWQFEFYLKP